MAHALAVLSLVVALCAYTVVAGPDANVVIEDLKQSTALANNLTTQANAIPLLIRFNTPNGQVILDGVNALAQRFKDANQYLQDNPGTFAKESETAVLQAYTAYVQAQQGFLRASVEVRDNFPVLIFRPRIAQALENLYQNAEKYSFSLEAATPDQAPAVEDQAVISTRDLVEATRRYSRFP